VLPVPEPGEGVMAGNSRAALPAPMSTLAAPFRLGIGPSGSVARLVPAAGILAGDVLAAAGADAAVTAVVSVAVGGVQVPVPATVAVAVSFTELTEVALDATAICACKLAGCFVVTEAMLHVAVPPPLAQPLVNVGFWLDGCAVSATDTSEADPFWVETWIT